MDNLILFNSDLHISEADNLVQVLEQNRRFHYEKWKDIASFISPNRFKANPNLKNDGRRKDAKILRNQARLSTRTFVSGMMNGATPQSRPWFKATVANESKANDTQAKRFFAATEKIFNSHFQMSNLYRILPMAYKDVALFSNSAYAMLPHDRYGFYFFPFAIGTYSFACDSEGNVNTFCRRFTLSVRQVVEAYGVTKPNGHIDWDQMDPWVKGEWENQRYLSEVTLINLIVPNRRPRPNSLYSRDKIFQSYTWVDATKTGATVQHSRGFRNEASLDGRRDGFLSIKGYDYFPVITPRWEVEADEDYGCDGPAEIAIGDVKALQSMERSRLEAIAKLVKPPMTAPASMRRHQASILAGGITYLDNMGAADQGFKPAFMVDPKLNELLMSQSELVATIRTAFYEDLFLMLANERMTSHITAAEINERSAEKMNALSPVLGQLDQDQNGRLFDNAYIILSGQGKLPPIPRALQGEELRPEYISILAQAAKMSQVNSLERAINFGASMANTFQNPSLLRIFKADKIIRFYGDYMGVDPELMADEQEFAQIEQIAMQQQQAQQQAQMMAQEASTAKDLASAETTGDNLLSMMVNNEAVA